MGALHGAAILTAIRQVPNTDERRIRDCAGIAVNEALLPVYLGLEIPDGVMEATKSVVFDQATIRFHFQNGLPVVLTGNA